LEEAAQVLNVCPATVRRYTNRGMLPHFRSSGNQRRFRLSKVLQFMETHERKAVNGTFDFEDVQEE
jgi:excisionase family DNA binding protein